MNLNKKTLIRFLSSGILFASLSFSRADDWPQWRGPNRDGISKEKGLLKQWPKQGPKLFWQIKTLGDGYSTPAIAGDRLYVQSNEGLENESIHALDVGDGKQIWVTRLGKVGEPNQQPAYPAARSTPTVDHDLIYALGSDGDLACLDLKGAIKWKKSLRADFGGKPGRWAYSESPLVDGDRVVCTPGGPEATMVALNKKTGQVIWKCPVPEGDLAAYASIIINENGGTKQYINFTEKGVIGVDAKTGKFLWRYNHTAKGSPANIPTPVAAENYIYTASSLGGGGLIKVEPNGGKFEADEVYFAVKLPKAIGGAVKVGDYLYGTIDKAMMCVDFKTGKPKWEETALGTGSVLYADGNLYVHAENSGEVGLVEATPDAYKEKGRFTPPERASHGPSKAWAYPVVANGALYIREGNSIWKYDIKAK